MRPGRRVALAAILLPLLVGCPPRKDVTDTDVGPDINSPAVKLQVAAVDPSFSPADRAFDAELYGSGFESGARVTFNGAAATSVKFVDENGLKVGVPAMPMGSYDVTVTNPDGVKSTLRKGLTLTEAVASGGTGCSGVTVRFDLDSTVLNAASRSGLDTLAGCLRSGTATARIEGHCDERGTTEYNIALGQRRGDAVYRYLVGQGVSPNRLQVSSFGEERPLDRSGSESAHAQNRRAEIKVRE